VFEHFQEIRFQINEHRERLKVKIDDIALAMIETIKKHEEAYIKELKKSFSSFDDGQYLQIKLNELEETFRNPNLLIKTIKEMQQKQEESLKEIQLKLDEMTIVKVN
jgi:exosome complex RNA-binding protein Rrp4